MSSVRSSQLARRKIQPCNPAATAAMAKKPRKMIHAASIHEPPGGSFKSTPTPIGSSTKKNGTTNAGMVYFHACIVVLYGSPPVMAAAAKGESAVGGDTSESSA